MKRTGLFLLLLFFYARALASEAVVQTTAMTPFDVLHYDAQIERTCEREKSDGLFFKVVVFD